MVPKRWQATQIGDVATFSSGGTPSKQTADYWGGGEPWISGKDLKSHYLNKSIDTLTEKGFATAKKAPQGASLILVRGMTLLKDFPVGYASREVAFNQDIKALVPKKNVDGLFLSFLLVAQKNRIRQLVSTAGHGTGRLDTSLIQGYPINLPPLPEQKKIAQILSTWDQAITATERLLENSQQRKKGLMQQLLTGKKRLPGFEGEWDEVKVGTVLSVRKDKQIPSEDAPLYSLTIESGITEKTDRYNREFLVKDAKEKQYKKVLPKDIVYNPANLRWGAINYSRLSHTVVVSPIYEVLYVTEPEKHCLEFLAQSLMRPDQINRFASMVEGTLMERMAVKIGPFLATRLRVPPSVAEEQAIATILSAADSEIIALNKRLRGLEQEKKALMQQLLTGKRRVQVDTEAA